MKSWSSLSIALLLFLSVPSLYASTGDTVTTIGFGTITITQETPQENVYGEWTVLKPGNLQQKGRHGEETIEDSKTGNYTIIVDPPEGATASVAVYINGELTLENTHQQAGFSLPNNGDEVEIVITLHFTRVGTVTALSDPPGLDFTVKGPNNTEFKGTTPETFYDVSEGLYTIFYEEIEGCITPKPQSKRLEKDSRISLSIIIACENLESTSQKQEVNKKLEFVTTIIDGRSVVFEDVPITSWFASFVDNAIRTGIMSGYQNESGNFAGEFGPGDTINLAQLAKIAHRLAGVDETIARWEPENIRARGTWFEQFYASAEYLGWLVYMDHRNDPGRDATRSEVVATILQALDIPRHWPKGKLFTDVQMTTPYSSSIETAATDGIVSGFTDDNGSPTGQFGPDDPITRAGIAKVISQAMEVYVKRTSEIQGVSY